MRKTANARGDHVLQNASQAGMFPSTGDEVRISLIPATNGAPVGSSGNGVSYTAGVYTQLKVVRPKGGDPIPLFTVKKTSN